MIFFLLSLQFLSIFVFILLILFKKNTYYLGNVVLFFQILIAIITVIRERNFEKINFYILFLIFSLSLTTIFILPLLLNKILSDEKKLNLFTLEASIKNVLVQTYHEFVDNHSKIKKFFDLVSKKLTELLSWLVFSNKFLFFVWIPWVTFVNFFLLETVFTQKFIFSPYLLAYFFVFYRFFVILLFICKNTASSYYIWPLRKKLLCFSGLQLIPNMRVLKSILLNPKFVELKDKIQAWKDFNEFLSFFLEAKMLSNLYYHDLSEVKKFIDAINFSLVVSISLFFFSKNYLNLHFCWFLFLSFYTFFNWLFLQKLLKKEKSNEVVTFNDLLLNLKEFHGHFKWILITQHKFSWKDAQENQKKAFRLILPVSGRDFLIKSSFFHVLSLWFFFNFFIFSDFWFIGLKIYFSFTNFEPFFLPFLLG